MFRSERLVYRAIEDSDSAFILDLNGDAETQLATTANLPVPQGQRHAQMHLLDYASCMLSAVICLPTVRRAGEAGDLHPIGIITLKADEEPAAQLHRNSKFDIILSRSARGRGYGSEAVLWMLEWAFRQAAVHKVATSVFEFNAPSIKMCEKLRFELDGRLREEVWNDGRYWDHFIFSMLESDWARLYGRRQVRPR